MVKKVSGLLSTHKGDGGGRAVDQAVSRSLASHRIGPCSRMGTACGICGGQSGTEAGFGRSAEWTQLDCTPHYTD
jgi:hypothetical protein